MAYLATIHIKQTPYELKVNIVISLETDIGLPDDLPRRNIGLHSATIYFAKGIVALFNGRTHLAARPGWPVRRPELSIVE